ncbi:MAG: transglycosylase domain-containing protein [Methyloligellaceae bacterium]
MLQILRITARILNFCLTIPYRAGRFLLGSVLLNPRLGRFRLIITPVLAYVVFAVALVYVYAPLRGISGGVWMGKALDYANERSLGTAIFDSRKRFVGIFDPVMDSEEDVNYTGRPIALPDYIAYPDHKSLHVDAVPEDYWRCLAYQEDRHLGGWLNPFGIDLMGVLKIPSSTVERSIQAGRPKLGAGGSTLAMQLARIFFKTPPRADESAVDKLKRKLKEWWLAPVIHWQLVRGKDIEALKHWTANHLPLAQRTGGQALYGVAQTSLIVFGKPAKRLTTAEQYVLAAAVNQPIILLTGGKRLNAVRARSWRRIVGSRARVCARALLDDPARRDAVRAELTRIAAVPPDPVVPQDFAETVARHAPTAARPASASPIRRSNALIPATKYGVRDELKNRFGFGWRAQARQVVLTLNAAENLAFRSEIKTELTGLQSRFRGRIGSAFTLDLEAARGREGTGLLKVPDVVVAAADRNGRVVRYFESNFNAAYFGSARARDPATGTYDPSRESRFIASIGKIAAAIAISNDGSDGPDSKYLDTRAPGVGLEACKRGRERRLRHANVAFACSLNTPIEWRMRRLPARDLRQLADGLSLVRQARGAPLAKSLVVGQVAASPRTVHQMAGLVLGAVSRRGQEPVPAPSLVARIEGPSAGGAAASRAQPTGIRPETLIKPEGRSVLRTLLSAPICYRHGTLRRISDWCAAKRADVRLHFAKTGTRGTGALDPKADDTVDLWVAGGIEFENGAAFSYVVLIGTGNPSTPWGRDLYAGAVAEPLLRRLLEDLAKLAAQKGRTSDAPPALKAAARQP